NCRFSILISRNGSGPVSSHMYLWIWSNIGKTDGRNFLCWKRKNCLLPRQRPQAKMQKLRLSGWCLVVLSANKSEHLLANIRSLCTCFYWVRSICCCIVVRKSKQLLSWETLLIVAGKRLKTFLGGLPTRIQ